jgi:feruloyl esterase
VFVLDSSVSRYFRHGGKLLVYHGWNDQIIAPRNSINYYNSVVTAIGGASKMAKSIRLFMAPGMMHCGGGEGPNSFEAVTVLDQWLETGKAPDQMIASHRTGDKVDRTRPLCPYPQVVFYKGNGSMDEAMNFVCKAP